MTDDEVDLILGPAEPARGGRTYARVTLHINGQDLVAEGEFKLDDDSGHLVNVHPIHFPHTITTEGLVIAELRRAIEGLRRAWADDLRAERDLRARLHALADEWDAIGEVQIHDLRAILAAPREE